MGNLQSNEQSVAPALALEDSMQCERELRRYIEKQEAALCGPTVSPLWRAIVDRNLRAVRRAISTGHSPIGLSDAQGLTPLHYAVALLASDDVTVLQELCNAGAMVDAPSTALYRPLMLAAMLGKPAACRWLLEHGASVNSRSRRGSTAVHWAAAARPSAASRAVLQVGVRALSGRARPCVLLPFSCATE